MTATMLAIVVVVTLTFAFQGRCSHHHHHHHRRQHQHNYHGLADRYLDKANWWVSFNKKGASNCKEPYLMKGLWKSACNKLYCIEVAYCVRNRNVYATGPVLEANWWSCLDNGHGGWCTCRDGSYLTGFYRTSGQGLHNLEKGYCHNVPHSRKWGACYGQDVRETFNRKGLSKCVRHGHFMVGLWKSKNCDGLNCIKRFKCCRPAAYSSSRVMKGWKKVTSKKYLRCFLIRKPGTNKRFLVLKSAHNKWLSANDKTIVNDKSKGRKELFQPIFTDGFVSLKTWKGKYLSAQPDGSLQTNRDHIGQWEKFQMYIHGDRIIALLSSHGKWLSAQPNGRMVVNRNNLGPWEKFYGLRKVNGGYSSWSSFGSCIGGVKSRTRQCNNPLPRYGGKDCSRLGSASQMISCTTCKVNGGYSSWSSFGSCIGGVKTRTRKCNNPSPRYGGKDCSRLGAASQMISCTSCKVNGGYGPWKSYKCSKSCGGGKKKRIRRCNNPSPKHGGKNCSRLGPASQKIPCNTQPCRVNGGYGPWKSFKCSKFCGGGKKKRLRRCNNPSPKHGGKNCSRLGPAFQTIPCNTQPCRAVFVPI